MLFSNSCMQDHFVINRSCALVLKFFEIQIPAIKRKLSASIPYILSSNRSMHLHLYKHRKLIFTIMFCATQICWPQKQSHGAGRINLPFELLEGLPFAVSCMSWGTLGVLVGDLRLSRFMLSTQACAEDAPLFWGKVLFETDNGGWDEFAEVFNLAEGTHCPGGWDVFPWDFPAPLVESTLLSKVAGCLVSFELLFGVFRRSLHIFLVGCTAWVAVLDCETVRSCSFSVVTLELLGWDRLKGIGLVHGFFFLAFPCRNM